MSNLQFIDRSALPIVLMLCFCLRTDAFSWSPVQQAQTTVSSLVGSTAVLSCEYTLSPSEQARTSSFFVLSWSREHPRGSGQWATLVLDSPPAFLGRQDLNLNDRFHFGLKSSLRVYGVTEEDDTNYRCEYRSSFPTTPKKVRLNVQYKPKETQLKTKSANLKFGEKFLMNCSSRANPSPYYQLYRNGNLVQNSSNGLFQVKEMDRSHGGDYKCVPVNMFGEGPVKTLTITVEGSAVTTQKQESFFDNFPMWVFGAIAGGCLMVVVLVVVVACRCRNGKNEGIYQPKLNEQGGTVSSLNLANDPTVKSGPDMYSAQRQRPITRADAKVPNGGSTKRVVPTYADLATLKETAIHKPANHPEAHDGPYTSLRTSTDLDQQYQTLNSFGVINKLSSDDKKDHPESYVGPYSNRDSTVSEIVPDRVVKEEEDEQEEEVLEVEEAEEQCEMAEEMKPEEESRSASPPPEQLYIQISKEEYV